MTSTVRKYSLEKTRMLCPYGEPCMRYYGLLKDPEGRATFGVSLVIGSLKINKPKESTAVRSKYERFSSPAMFLDRSCASISISGTRRQQEKRIYSPSTRTVTLSSTLLILSSIRLTTFKVSAIAIRVSSMVSVSNLFSASSMSFLPNSFFTILSLEKISQEQSMDVHQLTRSTLLNLLCDDAEKR